MSIFLSDAERNGLIASMDDPSFRNQWVALCSRVRDRAVGPGLPARGVTTTWWYHVAEFLSDAAIVQAVEGSGAQSDSAADKPTAPPNDLAVWIRDTTLSIVRRPEEDWVGPYYRDHTRTPRIGHLETAHLAIGVAIVLDMVPQLFSPPEIAEISGVLRDRAIPLCERWLDFAQRLNNWRCVLAAGMAVAGAVVGDRTRLARAKDEFVLCCELFQTDGSYAESLQYGSYAAWGLMMSYEALVRTGNAGELSIAAYAKKVVWDLYSFLYTKPLSGWGPYPRPRSVNFNDCAAMYRASGDLLAHIAARSGDRALAALSRRLYERWYGREEHPNAGPFDLATFGLFNAAGFLTFVHFAAFPEPEAPTETEYPLLKAFENGDVFARADWNGDTVLAMRAGGGLLRGPSHLHGDMNSFVLVHRRERLLVDPGHSCYRNVTRSIEVDARVHNTCVFHPVSDELELDQRQEDLFKSHVIGQKVDFKRPFRDGRPGPPVDRGTRVLLLEQHGRTPADRITVVAADAAAVYGAPVERFTRIWLLIGENVLLVCDRFSFSAPCRIEWNWSLNNRDDSLEFDIESNRHLRARRGGAGVRVFHGSRNSAFMGPLYSLMHDHYHPEPAQKGEGRPGSSLVFRWTGSEPTLGTDCLHLFLMDSSADIDRWTVVERESGIAVEAPGARSNYLVTSKEIGGAFSLEVTSGNERLGLLEADGSDGYRFTSSFRANHG